MGKIKLRPSHALLIPVLIAAFIAFGLVTSAVAEQDTFLSKFSSLITGSKGATGLTVGENEPSDVSDDLAVTSVDQELLCPASIELSFNKDVYYPNDVLSYYIATYDNKGYPIGVDLDVTVINVIKDAAIIQDSSLKHEKVSTKPNGQLSDDTMIDKSIEPGIYKYVIQSKPGCKHVEATQKFEIRRLKGKSINIIKLNAGWNLVGGRYISSSIRESTCSEDNIAAAYAYNPIANEYVDLKLMGEDRVGRDFEKAYPGYALFEKINSFWVNVVNSCKIEYEVSETHGLLKEIKDEGKRFPKGWNFLTVTPEMVGKTMAQFAGDCNIERAYGWDTFKQEWGDIGKEDFLDLDESAVGYGFVAKLADDCSLINALSPPPLPSLPE